MELEGFSGYYVNRFNDVYSFRSIHGKILNPWLAPCGSGAKIAKLTLFDDEGKRRQLSRRKVLICTLGKTEFDRREALRAERAPILAKEAAEAAERKRKADEEEERFLREVIHKDTNFTSDVPLHQMDPHVAKRVEQARLARKQKADKLKKETLGDLF